MTRCPQCSAECRINFEDEGAAEAFRIRVGYRKDSKGRFEIDQCCVCGWGGLKRSTDVGGFFIRELAGITGEWPRMGRLCKHCNLRIPMFLDLDPGKASQARAMIKAGRMIDAIKSIEEATGCGPKWAHLWATHPTGPIHVPTPWPGPPCSYCGKPLRSKLAKQCFECGMDWHDPDNVRRL